MSDTAPQTTTTTSSESSGTTTIGDARAALAAADASTATPESTPASTASTPAAAITPPVETETTPESANADGKGEPPKWRWQDILANTRDTVSKETEERVRKDLEAKYQGLDAFATLDPQERAGMLVWHRAMNGDAQARAMVAQADAKLAASLGWAQAPSEETEPAADLQTSDGTPVYSAPQLQKWQQWNSRRQMAEFRKELANDPERRAVKQVIASHQKAEAHANVTSVLTELKAKHPEFETHRAEVGAVIKADPKLWALADSDPSLAMELAWNRVWREKVLPQQQKHAEADTLAHLQQRAVAATTNPAAASTSTPKNTLGDARAALEYAYAQGS